MNGNLFRSILRVYSEHEQKPANIIGKLIEIILSGKEDSVTLISIKDDLDKLLNLDIEIDRLIIAIKRRSKNIVMTISNDYENSKYYLIDSAKREINNIADITFRSIVSGFKNHSSYKFEEHAFAILFDKFIYFIFDNTQSQIIRLLKNDYVINSNTKDFSKKEIMILNEFISWDNNEKNDFLSKVISYGFEYCMLVTNTDSKELKDIFRKTSFYLDSNILIRATGIDGEFDRMNTLKFYKKLKDLNSNLLITSITYKEVISTIRFKIKSIEKILRSTEEETIISAKKIFGVFDDSTFSTIEFFFKWSRMFNSKKIGGFISYVLSQFEKLITEYKIAVDNKNLNEINEDSTNSLYNYKKSRTQYEVRIQGVETDTKNLDYIKSLRPDIYHNKSQIKHFFVSEDQRLYSWSREYYTDIMPILVSPNSIYQFYSKYYAKGKDDDFIALRDFISLRKQDFNMGIKASEITEIVTTVNKITSDKEMQDTLMYYVRQDFEENLFSNGGIDLGKNLGKNLEQKLKKKYDEIVKEKHDADFEEYRKIKDVENILMEEERLKNTNSIIDQVLENTKDIFTSKFKIVLAILLILTLILSHIGFIYYSCFTSEGLSFYESNFDFKASSIAGATLYTAILAIFYIPLGKYILSSKSKIANLNQFIHNLKMGEKYD